MMLLMNSCLIPIFRNIGSPLSVLLPDSQLTVAMTIQTSSSSLSAAAAATTNT